MKQPSCRISLLLFSLLISTQAVGVPDEKEEKFLQLQAIELRNSAKTQRDTAEKGYAAEERVCLGKFLVNSCLEDAKKVKQQALSEAKRAEQEARSIDRKIKANERELKAARRQAEAPQRAAEAARRAEESQRDYEEALQRVERKQAGAAPRKLQ
ncbi:MAG: hypothetical protein ACYCWC_03145 [Rhodocyclaceae bacterium]